MTILKAVTVSLLILQQYLASPFLYSDSPRKLQGLIAVDTLSNLRQTAGKDADNMKETLEFVAIALGLKPNLYMLKDKELTAKNLKTWTDTLKRKSDDIVVFYFSGHGFRTADSKDQWPYLYLSSDRNAVEGTWFIETIKKIQPRLALLIYDCCNNDPYNIPKFSFPSRQFLMRKAPDYSGLQRLFAQTKGLIIASASIPGKSSYGGDKGGLFTLAFINRLWNESGNKDINWEKLMKSTKELCSSVPTPTGPQVPQYKLTIK